MVESRPKSALRNQRVASRGSVLSGPEALGVASDHSDAWLPVSHRLSDTKTSDRARSVNTTAQTHPPPVTQIAFEGRGR